MRPLMVARRGPSAETFFSEVCATLLRARARTASDTGGRFVFQLRGKNGGTWLVDLSKTAVLKNPSSPEADVVVAMVVADFEAMLTGTLDTQKALDDGRITISGDRSRLAQLGPILRPLNTHD